MIKSSFLVLAVALAAVTSSGCDTCEKAAQTINDLTKAKSLLQEGLANPTGWEATCDTLVQSADIFRSDAEFLRSVADHRYDDNWTGCAERGWIDYCHGGWGHFPDGELFADASMFESILTEERGGHGGGGHGGGGHGGGGHGGGGHDGWHPGHGGHWYPPYYPYHPGWRWGWAPRVCESVEVCLRWVPGSDPHPGYNHVMSIAYELDQAAGGIETACMKTRDGAPVGEVNTVAQETLDRVTTKGLPGATGVYDSLGCNARSGD